MKNERPTDLNELAKQLVAESTEGRDPLPDEPSEKWGRVRQGKNKGRLRQYKPRWRELLGFSEPKPKP